ncbi:MAG: hypothetical protein NTY29_11800 [Proteobacteria bacterium]|nr:hypothetical protein [Pseudomonadota bacterium]
MPGKTRQKKRSSSGLLTNKRCRSSSAGRFYCHQEIIHVYHRLNSAVS